MTQGLVMASSNCFWSPFSKALSILTVKSAQCYLVASSELGRLVEVGRVDDEGLQLAVGPDDLVLEDVHDDDDERELASRGRAIYLADGVSLRLFLASLDLVMEELGHLLEPLGLDEDVDVLVEDVGARGEGLLLLGLGQGLEDEGLGEVDLLLLEEEPDGMRGGLLTWPLGRRA